MQLKTRIITAIIDSQWNYFTRFRVFRITKQNVKYEVIFKNTEIIK